MYLTIPSVAIRDGFHHPEMDAISRRIWPSRDRRNLKIRYMKIHLEMAPTSRGHLEIAGYLVIVPGLNPIFR